jgi:hypothetical protein
MLARGGLFVLATEDWQKERWVIARNQEEALEKAKTLYPDIASPKLEQVWPSLPQHHTHVSAHTTHAHASPHTHSHETW